MGLAVNKAPYITQTARIILMSEGDISLRGWIETGGRVADMEDIRQLTEEGPGVLSSCGGEFLLRWDDCVARDHFGIMPGDCPAGRIVCNCREVGVIEPAVPEMSLSEAIRTAVRLRSGPGAVCAFSGGVDSALVAALAGSECVAIGLEGSHDLRHAKEVAEALGLSLTEVTVPEERVEEALSAVLPVIPRVTPVDAAVATTLFFVAEWAGKQGYERILGGHSADELFGGYARYLETDDLASEMDKDIAGLPLQCERDQAVASLHDVWFSEPYMDMRVVRAAGAIPPDERVKDGVRKLPLRTVASEVMPDEIACYEKKAMQYGSGIWKAIQRLARRNGYRHVGDWLDVMDRNHG